MIITRTLYRYNIADKDEMREERSSLCAKYHYTKEIDSLINSSVWLTCPTGWDTSKPHVLTYLNTIPNTRRLTTNKMITVIIFATAFRPLSVASALLEDRIWDGRRLPAKPLAKAGNAKLWVNVSLWMDCDKLLWPILLRVAALSKAYSRSSASNSEYLTIYKRQLVNVLCLCRLMLCGRDVNLKSSLTWQSWHYFCADPKDLNDERWAVVLCQLC